MESKTNGLTSFQLKLAALICMTIDHIAQFLAPVFPIPFWFHIIGRIAAPIFIYLTAWGAFYTHSKKKYLLRLYIFSAAMELLRLCANKFALHFGFATIPNNIFATLFLIVLYITLLDELIPSIRSRKYIRSVFIFLLMFLPFVLYISTEALATLFSASAGYWIKGIARAFLPDVVSCEGGLSIVLLGVVFYLLRDSKTGTAIFYIIYCISYLLRALPGGIYYTLTVNVQWMMILALPLLMTYNGRLGSKTQFAKYLFYIYYPAHIFLLYTVYVAGCCLPV